MSNKSNKSGVRYYRVLEAGIMDYLNTDNHVDEHKGDIVKHVADCTMAIIRILDHMQDSFFYGVELFQEDDILKVMESDKNLKNLKLLYKMGKLFAKSTNDTLAKMEVRLKRLDSSIKEYEASNND